MLMINYLKLNIEQIFILFILNKLLLEYYQNIQKDTLTM